MKPWLISPVADARHPGLRRLVEVAEPGAEPLAAQQLGQPLGRSVALGDQHHPPPVRQPLPHVGDRARGIAAVAIRPGSPLDAERQRGPLRPPPASPVPRSSVSCLARLARLSNGVTSTRRCPAPGRGRPDLGHRLERGRAQVDRRLAAGGGVHPGGLEELLAGARPGRRPGPGSAPGRRRAPGRRAARGPAAAPSGPPAPARTPPCPPPRCPRPACRARRPARGTPRRAARPAPARPGSAAARGTAAPTARPPRRAGCAGRRPGS